MAKVLFFCIFNFLTFSYLTPIGFSATSTSSKVQVNPEELESARELTNEAHGLNKTIKFYWGETSANNTLNLAINTLPIDVTPELWKECLRISVINNQSPPDMEKKSKAWAKAYIYFMKKILSILKPIAIAAEEEYKNKYGSQVENYSKIPFDHWVTSKDRE